MIRRLLFAIFFAIGGFVFWIPKWVIMGTRASRDRKKMLKLQKEMVKQQRS